MKKGVTLIEVLVASLLLVITIGAIMMSFVQHQAIISQQSFQHEAAMILQEEFEGIKGTANRTTLLSHINKDYNENFSLDSTVAYSIKYTTKEITVNTASLLEITGTLSWTQAGKKHSISLETRSNN